jgi:hypothetical protein
MAELNITNSAGRDAVVNMESVKAPVKIRWLDASGRQAMSIRLVKSTIVHDIGALLAKAGSIGQISDQLIQDDPEIDLETVGTFLTETTRVYVDKQGSLAHRIQQFEIIKNPDGSERERRPRQQFSPNITPDSPLRWSGKLIKKNEAIRKFVFSNKVQLLHINGLTYDFLFGMARELESSDSLLIMGAGPKSNQPLIFRRGSVPYRGFLEGRTQGDQYCLVLHLSNLELKAPEGPSDSAEDSQANAD